MPDKTKTIAKKPAPKRYKTVQTKKSEHERLIDTPADHIMSLHQTIGNRAVRRLFESGTIQASLKIGQPNDKYEQEADRVADEVMRMPEPQVQRQTEEEEQEEEELVQTKSIGEQITPLVQRQVEPEEEEEETIQAKAEGQTPQVTPNLETRINTLQGGGQSLSKETRNFFESWFGHDFSGVRVHTDSNANQMARSINARAFTRGNDVIFRGGEYNPESSGGKRLLGHELTHVVQQNSRVQTSLLQRLEEHPLPGPRIITEPLVGGGSRSYTALSPPSAASEGAAQTAEGNLRWTFRRHREGQGLQMNPRFWSVTYHLNLRSLNPRFSEEEILISNDARRTALQNARNYLLRLRMLRWRERHGYPLSRIEIRLRSGVTPVAAARDLVNTRSARYYAFECWTAAALIQFVGTWRGLQRTSSDEATFNQRYADFRMEHHSEGASLHMGGEEIEENLQLGEFSLLELLNDRGDRGLRRGDWVYLNNRSLISRGPFQGENATYLGNNHFHGHGIGQTGVFDLNQYVEALRRRLAPESSSLTADEILERVLVRPFYSEGSRRSEPSQ